MPTLKMRCICCMCLNWITNIYHDFQGRQVSRQCNKAQILLVLLAHIAAPKCYWNSTHSKIGELLFIFNRKFLFGEVCFGRWLLACCTQNIDLHSTHVRLVTTFVALITLFVDWVVCMISRRERDLLNPFYYPAVSFLTKTSSFFGSRSMTQIPVLTIFLYLILTNTLQGSDTIFPPLIWHTRTHSGS